MYSIVPKSGEAGRARAVSAYQYVIYKIASKMVANKLQIILSSVISEEQSIFVARRLITDNILMMYVCLHCMKENKARESKCCVMKLDM
jgi:sialic acid synthase SpsE